MKTSTSGKSLQGGAKKQTKSDNSNNSSNANSELQELFVKELKDIYWAEKALVKAIPKMIKNATSPELVEALESHLSETEEQVNRAEEVFSSINVKPEAKKCEAMVGLIKEAEEIMSDTKKGMMRDAAIIAAAQKVEHYEIASYGTLCAFARTLGHDEALELLEETLNEEKEADSTLTEIAESSVNEEAVSNSAEQ